MLLWCIILYYILVRVDRFGGCNVGVGVVSGTGQLNATMFHCFSEGTVHWYRKPRGVKIGVLVSPVESYSQINVHFFIDRKYTHSRTTNAYSYNTHNTPHNTHTQHTRTRTRAHTIPPHNTQHYQRAYTLQHNTQHTHKHPPHAHYTHSHP